VEHATAYNVDIANCDRRRREFRFAKLLLYYIFAKHVTNTSTRKK